ncbi:MAG: zf-HC2 domain-containing protein [Candidatus Omnitrophota bacterium]|jgi:hypothetical protein
MNCKQVRNAILTGYCEGEIAEKDKEIIKAHIAGCAECGKFEAAIVNSALEPFRGVNREEAPPEIWNGIYKELSERPVGFQEYLKRGVKRFFVLPRPALLAVSSVSVCVVAAFLIYFFSGGKTREAYVELKADEQMQYIAYITGFSDSINGKAAEDYTDIDKIFAQ